MARVLIAGGTGLIGQQLNGVLRGKGHEVILLSRRAKPDAEFPTYRWSLPEGHIDPTALEGVDYIINLAGAGVADKRWTPARKKLLIESRTQGAALFAKLIQEGKVKPKAYISASAVGYYGNRGDELVTEDSPAGKSGFLAACTVAWENAIKEVADTGVRMVALRIGIVLSTKGGALEKMLKPFRLGIGNWFGKGNQYYSWIHINDMCRMLVFSMENEQMQGFYNAVAPQPVTNKQFTYAIREARGKPALMMPAPALVLKLALGEMSEMILHGVRASSAKIEAASFEFEHPDLVEALRGLGV